MPYLLTLIIALIPSLAMAQTKDECFDLFDVKSSEIATIYTVKKNTELSKLHACANRPAPKRDKAIRKNATFTLKNKKISAAEWEARYSLALNSSRPDATDLKEVNFTAHNFHISYKNLLTRNWEYQLQSGLIYTSDSEIVIGSETLNPDRDFFLSGRAQVDHRFSDEVTVGGFYRLNRYLSVHDDTSGVVDYSYLPFHTAGVISRYQLNNFSIVSTMGVILPNSGKKNNIERGTSFGFGGGYFWNRLAFGYTFHRNDVSTKVYDDVGYQHHFTIGLSF